MAANPVAKCDDSNHALMARGIVLASSASRRAVLAQLLGALLFGFAVGLGAVVVLENLLALLIVPVPLVLVRIALVRTGRVLRVKSGVKLCSQVDESILGADEIVEVAHDELRLVLRDRRDMRYVVVRRSRLAAADLQRSLLLHFDEVRRTRRATQRSDPGSRQ